MSDLIVFDEHEIEEIAVSEISASCDKINKNTTTAV
jgi:hypothetical protein